MIFDDLFQTKIGGGVPNYETNVKGGFLEKNRNVSTDTSNGLGG
jgi:hypothetical protein